MRIYDIETLQNSYNREMNCVNQILKVIPEFKEMIKKSDGKTFIVLNKLLDEKKLDLSSWIYLAMDTNKWSGYSRGIVRIIPKDRSGADFYSREVIEPKMDGRKIIASEWIEELEKLEIRLKRVYIELQENSKPENIEELRKEAIRIISLVQDFNSRLDRINQQMFRLSQDMGQ